MLCEPGNADFYKTVDLTLWMIKSVPQHDEEVQTAYAPLLLLSVQEVVHVSDQATVDALAEL